MATIKLRWPPFFIQNKNAFKKYRYCALTSTGGEGGVLSEEVQ
ncbi:MAG: hypothetical protein U5J82_03360 [Desulfobacterales bacterium]|nr:hypothetical protein [Desulfobacterales bacterium]